MKLSDAVLKTKELWYLLTSISLGIWGLSSIQQWANAKSPYLYELIPGVLLLSGAYWMIMAFGSKPWIAEDDR